MGSRCGSVVRVVASITIDLQFESSHQQYFIFDIITLRSRKDENEEKETLNGSFKTAFELIP